MQKKPMADAQRAERWPLGIGGSSSEPRHDGERQTDGRPGIGNAALDHPAGPRRDGTRIGADAHIQGGKCLPSEGCEDMGDASEPRLERRKQFGTHEPDGRTDGRAGIMPINCRTS